MSEHHVAPQLVAILICDEIIRDRATFKATLVGLFNLIAAPSFPCVHRGLHVYVSLTNGHGKAQAELRLVLRETNQVIGRLHGEVQFPDPLAVVEMDYELPEINFPREGLYSFDLYCDGILIGARPFRMVRSAAPPAPPR